MNTIISFILLTIMVSAIAYFANDQRVFWAMIPVVGLSVFAGLIEHEVSVQKTDLASED